MSRQQLLNTLVDTVRRRYVAVSQQQGKRIAINFRIERRMHLERLQLRAE